MTDSTWHMTAQQQIGSAAGCLFLVAMIALGIWTIVKDVRATWSIDDANDDIDDLTGDYFMGRDQHLVADRAAMQAARAS